MWRSVKTWLADPERLAGLVYKTAVVGGGLLLWETTGPLVASIMLTLWTLELWKIERGR
jgi:hypothetical protein